MGSGDITTGQECVWEVDGLRLTGLAWGPEDGLRVLALHGWMDHAASFQVLAPKLTGCRVVALDLSGQGLSAHRAAHATYNIWDDLPQIAGLLDRLGWKDCVLIGHSRGANISALFAAAQPERVRAFVALDSLVPAPTPETDFATVLGAFIEETRAKTAGGRRKFASVEDYVERRQAKGNARRTSELLAERALEPDEEGVHMRGDPRLYASSAVKLSPAHVETVLRSLKCPVLNIWANDGTRARRKGRFDPLPLARQLIPTYEAIFLDGDHHFHLDGGQADAIAQAVLDFLRRHHVG